MKKFILPIVIILGLILAVLFTIFISNTKNEQNNDNPSGTEVITPEITEEIEKIEEVEETDIYTKYNIEPGSYEAELLDLYSGDSDFVSEDNDGDGFPDGIFKEVPEAPLLF